MKEIFAQAIKTLSDTANDAQLMAQMAQMVDWCRQALQSGNKIMLCGNGGSASQAQHIAAEFVGRYKKERKGLAALALTTDTSILTCVSNDYSYDVVFSRQVEALGNKGDILFALTTSGNSKNCLAAVEAAKAKGIRTIAFTGKAGGKIKDLADLCFRVPSDITAHIQEVHITTLHAVCHKIDEDY